MANNTTNTYGQAKDIFNSSDLFKTNIIEVKNASIFRKHLSEMIKRQRSDKKFTSTLLDKNQLEVIRIK